MKPLSLDLPVRQALCEFNDAEEDRRRALQKVGKPGSMEREKKEVEDRRERPPVLVLHWVETDR